MGSKTAQSVHRQWKSDLPGLAEGRRTRVLVEVQRLIPVLVDQPN